MYKRREYVLCMYWCCMFPRLQVKLMDSVVSALDFAKARDSEIAWIDARIETQAPDDDDDQTGALTLAYVTKSSCRVLERHVIKTGGLCVTCWIYM